MSGYPNSGDNSPHSNTAQDNLGGSGDITHITEAEIAVIVVTVVGLAAALVAVFYCRILRTRREMDMENKAKQRKAPGEDPIELRGQKRVSGGSCDTGLKTECSSPRELEANCDGKKPSLRHYIHWKNPVKETLPQSRPRDSLDGESRLCRL